MKKNTYFTLLFSLLILLNACSDDGEDMPSSEEKPNILLIIADDLGKDALSGFTEGDIKPNTPNIDAFRNNGLSFSNFWVNPTCTPTRSTIFTGKYGYRTGVKWAGDVLDPSETSIQQFINNETMDSYASAIIGKWHLSGNNTNFNPESFGIDYYAGLIRGAVNDYEQWQLTTDGSTQMMTGYTTEVFTDLSIDWINAQTKPWFLWLAFNAPHTPFHAPPRVMHNQGDLVPYEEGLDPLPYYMAAIEAMDYQIGRLLDSLSSEEKDNTLIIFLGDNGTPIQVVQSPYSSSKAKGSLYQGGINVPLFVSGKGVTRIGQDENLITSTDLFATLAEIAGLDVAEIHDSKSFESLLTSSTKIREYQYAEMDDGDNNQWTISNGSFKLIVDAVGTEAMYDLENDPYEEVNLLDRNLSDEAAEAKSDLEFKLLEIRN